MAEQSISVPVSGVITLNVALPTGSTISNSSSTNAIWVSASPGLTPGNGMRIGPKGSLQWTTDRVACYAVADTGATAPIAITVSDNVAQLVNPVDIGVAVATQLLNTGVPSVLLQDTTSPSAADLAAGIDVSHYASLTVSLTYFGLGGAVVITFNDAANLATVSRRVMNVNQIASGTLDIRFVIPVEGAFLSIVPQFGSGVMNLLSARIVGSNRLAQDFQVSGITPSVNATATQAWVNNTPVPMAWFITNGGLHWARLVTTGTGKGYFYYVDYTLGAGKQIILCQDSMTGHVGPTGAQESYIPVYLPPGLITVGFQSAISASFQVIFTLINPTL